MLLNQAIDIQFLQFIIKETNQKQIMKENKIIGKPQIHQYYQIIYQKYFDRLDSIRQLNKKPIFDNNQSLNVKQEFLKMDQINESSIAVKENNSFGKSVISLLNQISEPKKLKMQEIFQGNFSKVEKIKPQTEQNKRYSSEIRNIDTNKYSRKSIQAQKNDEQEIQEIVQTNTYYTMQQTQPKKTAPQKNTQIQKFQNLKTLKNLEENKVRSIPSENSKLKIDQRVVKSDFIVNKHQKQPKKQQDKIPQFIKNEQNFIKLDQVLNKQQRQQTNIIRDKFSLNQEKSKISQNISSHLQDFSGQALKISSIQQKNQQSENKRQSTDYQSKLQKQNTKNKSQVAISQPQLFSSTYNRSKSKQSVVQQFSNSLSKIPRCNLEQMINQIEQLNLKLSNYQKNTQIIIKTLKDQSVAFYQNERQQFKKQQQKNREKIIQLSNKLTESNKKIEELLKWKQENQKVNISFKTIIQQLSEEKKSYQVERKQFLKRFNKFQEDYLIVKNKNN